MANTLRANIAAELSRIGNTAKTTIVSSNNVSPILHEFFVAKTMKGLIEKREEIAKSDMLTYAADAKQNLNIAPGETAVLFADNPDYSVTLRVNQPPEKFDKQAMIVALLKRGVKKTIIDQAIAEATTVGTPAKVYTIAPID